MNSAQKIRVKLSVVFGVVMILVLIDPATRGRADPPTLLIDLGGEKRQFSTAELLGNPAT